MNILQIVKGLREQGYTEGELSIDPEWYVIFEPENLEQYNIEYEIAKYAPGFTAFGSSGGGELLVINDSEEVFTLPAIGMAPQYADKIAGSIEDLKQFMNKQELSHYTKFFGNLVDLQCHFDDLKTVLKKTESIEFHEHEEFIDGESLISDIFPDITRKSFIVTLLIALDDQFKSYCDILSKATDQKLKWNNLKGSALERFILYSEKVCDVPNLYESDSRKKLAALIEVRNCIVHNNSNTIGFSKAKVIEEFSRKLDGLNIQDGYISLELSACYECADIVFKFMEQAYHAGLEAFPE